MRAEAFPFHPGATGEGKAGRVNASESGLIVEELGLDDGVTVLQQLGIIPNS